MEEIEVKSQIVPSLITQNKDVFKNLFNIFNDYYPCNGKFLIF
jgi:hypothetical protein